MKLEKNNNSGIIYRVARSNLMGNKLYSILTFLTIFFSISFVSTLVLFLLGTKIAEQRIVKDMQHVMFMSVTEEQLEQISLNPKTQIMIPYKFNDMEFETNNVKYSFYYSEHPSEILQTYTLSEGRIPESYEEIVVDKKFMESMGKEVVMDALIELNLNGTKQKFMICGYMDRGYEVSKYPIFVSKKFAESSPILEHIPYTALVRINEASDMTITEFETVVYQMAADYGIERLDINFNGKFEEFLQVGNADLYAILFVSALILAAGAVVIYSIFYLSVSSRVQQIGQLQTIGMTGKQIKKMIRREGLLLSGLAVPGGLILSGLVSYFLKPEGWSFLYYGMSILAIGFMGIAVVQFSVGKPAAIAAVVSPIEAARNSGPDEKDEGQNKKHKRLTTFTLAWMETVKNQKKWGLTTISLAFGGIVFMVAVTMMASWNKGNYSCQGAFRNAELYISYLYDAHSNPDPYGPTNLQLVGHLNEELKQRIQEIPGVKALEEKQTVYGNIEYKGASFGAEFGLLHKNSSEYFQAVTEGNNTYEYLAEHDGIMLLNIKFLEKLFGVEFHSGEKVRLSWFDGEEHSKELEITALIEKFDGDTESFFMTDQTIRKLWPDMNTASMFLISVEEYEKNGERVEQEIRTILNDYPDLSLSTLREQRIDDAASLKKLNIQIYGVCAFIIMFSILNLINTVISSITSRKKELSMLESIGMEERQIRTMLFWESLFIMLPNIVITLTIGTAAGFGSIVFMKQVAEYMEYHFPFIACILYMIAMLLTPIVISFLCLKGQNKRSLVERIKNND